MHLLSVLYTFLDYVKRVKFLFYFIFILFFIILFYKRAFDQKTNIKCLFFSQTKEIKMKQNN